jgi:ribosome recycling factor
VLGIDYEEYRRLEDEAVKDLRAKFEAAQENYRRVQYDFPKDVARREVAQDAYYAASWEVNKAREKFRKDIRDRLCKWEVVEV